MIITSYAFATSGGGGGPTPTYVTTGAPTNTASGNTNAAWPAGQLPDNG